MIVPSFIVILFYWMTVYYFYTNLTADIRRKTTCLLGFFSALGMCSTSWIVTRWTYAYILFLYCSGWYWVIGWVIDCANGWAIDWVAGWVTDGRGLKYFWKVLLIASEISCSTAKPARVDINTVKWPSERIDWDWINSRPNRAIWLTA